MQLLHGAIAVSAAAVILFLAPFGRWVRIALVFGYFPFFEYAVIARPYSLTLLLVLLACVFFRRRRRSLIGLAILLALLAQTTAFGLLLSGALAASLIVDELLVRRDEGRPLRPGWHDLAAAAVYVGALAGAVAQIAPPADASFGAGFSTPNVAHGTWPFSVVASALLPLRKPIVGSWGSNPWDEPYGILAGLVLLVIVALLARQPAALTCWIVASGSIVAFTMLRFEGQIRHHGHVFIAVLATFWICDSARPWPPGVLLRPRAGGRRQWDAVRRTAERLAPIGVGVVLAVQVVAGMTLSVLDIRFPFSSAEAAADYLRHNRLADQPILGDPDFLGFAVTAHLDRG
ncbi:MAG: hypothetical protein M3R01_14925, partial [Actinomycetota bacterium]|nr:hypothetical protein [Actinomycetota bacterium]